jgi:hypothetical protein
MISTYQYHGQEVEIILPPPDSCLSGTGAQKPASFHTLGTKGGNSVIDCQAVFYCSPDPFVDVLSSRILIMATGVCKMSGLTDMVPGIKRRID